MAKLTTAQRRQRFKRMLALTGVLYLVVGYLYWRSYWRPTCTIETDHYQIQSTATPEQTRRIGEIVEITYSAYRGMFGSWPGYDRAHPRLKMKLYKDREEFRRCNSSIGWAEAFYDGTYCQQYYSEKERNPYHWMIHEAVHQMNSEVSHLELPKWINEGIALYFDTSQLKGGRLLLGQIDQHTYPIWWVRSMTLSGDLERDTADTRVIPLAAIISGNGGPDIDRTFNLYYIHWWSLSHFLFEAEEGKYRQGYTRVIQTSGRIKKGRL